MRTSRKEIVKRAVHFERPGYIPLLHYGYNGMDYWDISDIIKTPVVQMAGGANGRTSEWGFVWKEDDTPFDLGQIETPAISGWEELGSYKPPDVLNEKRFDAARALMRAFPDRYFIADFVLSGFTIMSFIRGFDNFMMDLCLEPENVERLADIVFGAEEELISASAKAGFDAVGLADDYGSQRSLLFSPDTFREVFKPRLKRQIELAHSLGLDVFLHSCGYIMDIIPDLIEIGLDILNPGQPALNGIALLGERFRGQLCFACPAGYQTTGVTGTRGEIFDEIGLYVSELSKREGGFFGIVSHSLQSLGAAQETQQDVLAAWDKHCGAGNQYA